MFKPRRETYKPLPKRSRDLESISSSIQDLTLNPFEQMNKDITNWVLERKNPYDLKFMSITSLPKSARHFQHYSTPTLELKAKQIAYTENLGLITSSKILYSICMALLKSPDLGSNGYRASITQYLHTKEVQDYAESINKGEEKPDVLEPKTKFEIKSKCQNWLENHPNSVHIDMPTKNQMNSLDRIQQSLDIIKKDMTRRGEKLAPDSWKIYYDLVYNTGLCLSSFTKDSQLQNRTCIDSFHKVLHNLEYLSYIDPANKLYNYILRIKEESDFQGNFFRCRSLDDFSNRFNL